MSKTKPKETYKRAGKDVIKSPLTGQPTKYKPEYDEMLINHLKLGYSFETFVSIVNVNPDTLYEWLNRHESFSEAKKVGSALSRHYWEHLGKGGITGNVPGFNVTGWIFMMKNRFKWHDNVKIETRADPNDRRKDDQIQKLAEQLSALKAIANHDPGLE